MTTRGSSAPIRLLGPAAAVALIVAACSGQGTAGATSPAGAAGYGSSGGAGSASPMASAGASAGAYVVSVATDPKFGAHLVGEDGRSLYLLTKDSQDTATCTGACATTWPPFELEDGETVTAGAGASGTIATITRSDDGKRQVTYAGIPLYYFSSDTKAGDVNGEGVRGVWFLVGPGSTAASGRITGGVGQPAGSSAAAPGVPTPAATAASGGYDYGRGSSTPAPTARATAAPTAAPTPRPTATARPTARPTPAPTAAAGGGSGAVTLAGFAFSPSSLTVKAGTTVTWTNHDGVTHTVTADGGSFDSGHLASGATFSRTFATAGTFSYHCAIHPSMTGTITVTG